MHNNFTFDVASGASLVSIMDEAENRFLETNLLLLDSYKGFWIGLFKTYNGNATTDSILISILHLVNIIGVVLLGKYLTSDLRRTLVVDRQQCGRLF